MVPKNVSPDRSRQVDASTDPVIVGLGRLLVGIGVLALLGSLAVACLILYGCVSM